MGRKKDDGGEVMGPGQVPPGGMIPPGVPSQVITGGATASIHEAGHAAIAMHWRDFDPEKIADPKPDLLHEMIAYRDNLDAILKHNGEYVLIKGDRVVGYYATRSDAIAVLVQEFGKVPALVKQVVEWEPVARFGGIAG